MDKTLKMSILLDFFSDLLTQKQRDCFDLYYNENLSLSEIAEENGISRQAVRDLLMRTEKYLCELEEKTGVAERYLKRRAVVSEIQNDLDLVTVLNHEQLHSVELSELIENMKNKLRDIEL